MAHLKKLSWLAVLLPVLVCCGAPVLAAIGISALGGVLTGSLVVAAVLLLGGGALAGFLLLRLRHQASAACCALPPAAATTPTKEPASGPTR